MPKVLEKPQVIIKNGQPQAVILGIKQYEQLLEIAEEKKNLVSLKQALARARKNLKKGKTLTLHELREKLGFTS